MDQEISRIAAKDRKEEERTTLPLSYMGTTTWARAIKPRNGWSMLKEGPTHQWVK